MMDFIGKEKLTATEEAQYINNWLPLVYKITKQLAYQTSSVMDRDDMEQIALMGLLTALRRYGHPDEQFTAYAAQRIRGAILDELRQLDWRPRRLRQRAHKLNDDIRQIAREMGREPVFEDLKQQLNITTEEYQQHLLLNCASSLESLDYLLSTDSVEGTTDNNALEGDVITSKTLHAALSGLEEREQLILTLYYIKELSLKEIALVLSLTEARVCQLNKKITEKIKSYFHK
ncbi:FliA/WhiG family RNA polymerase sigma factor [Enterobacter ludwigii]|uniref:FliA/WhiG family RNA polymerase sigma factor n=1 Tax=Enterobacter ludwigii TaxID=299767 RepID=UPI003F70671E